MSAFKIFVTFYISLHCCIVLVNCNCSLNFPKNPRNIPRYKKHFGTRSLNIPYTADSVYIHEYGSITGYCATTLNDFTYKGRVRRESDIDDYQYIRQYGDLERNVYDDVQKTVTGAHTVSLYCQNDQLYYQNENIMDSADENGYNLVETTLSCKDIDWKIYESATSMPWCETNVGSYILASNYTKNQLILAGVCFDIEKVVLRNFHYSLNSKSSTENYNDLEIIAPYDLNTIKLGVEVPHFNSILGQISGKTLHFDEEKMNDWLKLANYQLHSIVQAGPYMDYFAKYEEMLQIMWWPALLYGNWKRFTNTLEDHVNNVSYSYDVFAGSSGILQAPWHSRKCIQKELQELQYGINNKTIPAYIWSYLKASDDSEEFVIIGYNAPFYDFFSEKDIIFCRDICDQITWLNEIRSSFRYSALGVIFCCSVKDVHKFNYLDGFPVQFEPPKVMPIKMLEASTPI